MKNGIKHLIKCRCVMPQFKNLQNPPIHQFVVFSAIEDEIFQSKYAQCNNCGLIHKVIDFCQSDILSNKESSVSLITKEELKLSIPPNLCKILEINDVDLPTWEMASFFYENKLWGNFVILNSEFEGSSKTGKFLQILGENLFKVNSFTREEVAREP